MSLKLSQLSRSRHWQLTVRAGRGAPVGVVAEGVNVHATLGVRVVACDVPGNLGRGRLGRLLESDGPGDLGVPPDNGDCMQDVVSMVTQWPSQGGNGTEISEFAAAQPIHLRLVELRRQHHDKPRAMDRVWRLDVRDIAAERQATYRL
jgi:hypothetical protein